MRSARPRLAGIFQRTLQLLAVGQALGALVQTVLPHGAIPGFRQGGLQAGRIGRFVDRRAQAVGDMEGLADRDPAAITGFTAPSAPGAIAVGAGAPHQPLRHHADQRGSDEKVLDAQIAQTGNRRRCVIGVQGGQDEVAGHRRLHRRARGLRIADFAHHDDVRIVPEEGAQCTGEGQIDGGIGLGLGDTRQAIFDRVLDGEDLALAVRQPLEEGIKRRRLARAGGTGDQDQPVRRPQHGLDGLAHRGGQAQMLQLTQAGLRVQQAQHQAFAVLARHDRDAQIDRTSGHGHREASVLGPPAFGDIEIGQDFYTRDDGQRLGGGPCGQIAQHAVHTHPDLGLALLQFDMHVRRLPIHGSGNEPVQPPDDRAGGGQIAQTLSIGRDIQPAVLRCISGVGRKPFGDQAVEQALGQHDGCQRSATGKGDAFRPRTIEGINKTDEAGFPAYTEGENAFRDEKIGIEDGQIDTVFRFRQGIGGGRMGTADLVGVKARDPAFAQQPGLGQDPVKRLAGLRLQGGRVRRLAPVQQSGSHKTLKPGRVGMLAMGRHASAA